MKLKYIVEIIFFLIISIIIIIVFTKLNSNNFTEIQKNEKEDIKINTSIKNELNTVNNMDVSLDNIKNNVTIEVVEGSVTKSSITLSITDKNETSYAWGKYYIIQKEKENEWSNVEPINTPIFNDLAFRLDENDNFLQRINWEKFYGELTNGIYRIVKPIYDVNKGDYIYFYSNEFEIK